MKTHISTKSTNVDHGLDHLPPSQAKGLGAQVAKLFRPCLPVPQLGKVLSKQKHASLGKLGKLVQKIFSPSQKKQALGLSTQPPSASQKNMTLKELFDAHSATQSPKHPAIRAESASENLDLQDALQHEIAAALKKAYAESEIIDLETIIQQFTAPKMSQWGHKHPETITRWVNELAEAAIEDTPAQFSGENAVNAWVAQQLEAPIQNKKTEIAQQHATWHAAVGDEEFKQTLQKTLLNVSSDEELDEDLGPALLEKVETFVTQPEHYDFSLQLDNGETAILPGAYVKTKAADWHTTELPKQISTLKQSLTKEIENIKQEQVNQDWEDVLNTQNLQPRLTEYVTKTEPDELASHCPELLKALIQQTLEAPENYSTQFTTQEGARIKAQGEFAKESGKAWRTETFPKAVQALEKQIDLKVQELLTLRENIKTQQSWNEAIDRMQMPSRLISHLTNPFKSEFGFQFPDIVKQLVDIKLDDPKNHFFYHTSRYNTTTRIASRDNKAELVEDTIHETILETQKQQFAQGRPWNEAKQDLQDNLASALKDHLKLDKQHTDLAQTLTDEALGHTQGYELFLTNNAFQGGYFKRKNLQTNEFLMRNTQVMGANGRRYELLNTLSNEDADQIWEQHGKNLPSRKTVIGEGGFGKVRYARDTETGEIVAVKKTKASVSQDDATAEVEQHQMILERIDALPLSSQQKSELEAHFALMQDYTHRWPTLDANADSSQALGPENKSYIFSPLANLGDGINALEEINNVYPANQMEASKRYLHIARSYAKAITLFHQLGLHHRDIKPDNFLHFNVTEEKTKPNGQIATRTVERIKLADFGLAQDEQGAKIWGGETDEYSPPEAISDERYNAEKHDCFSLGMSLLAIKLGNNPYKLQQHLTLKGPRNTTQTVALEFYGLEGESEKKRCQGVPSDQLNHLDMTHIDNIIAKLIAEEPLHRISAEEAWEHLNNLDPRTNHLV
jgi:serine/threonine protein kinase